MTCFQQMLRLYLVYDPALDVSPRPEDTIREAIAGGVTCFQIRAKSATAREIVELARVLRPLTAAAGVPLIINDRLDLAMAAGADGVHLGVDDVPLADARRMAGAGFIIGFSPETDDQIRHAGDVASYLGIGPFFSTTTKADAGVALGAAEFTRRRALTSLPVVAIGGITAENAAEPMAGGADGVAVVSAILGAPDLRLAALSLRRAIAVADTGTGRPVPDHRPGPRGILRDQR